MPAALQELLAPEYLADLPSRDLDELRAMRQACREVETGLSLLRRVVQGHLDIVAEEQARRAADGGPRDRAELVARLPAVLADRTHGPGPGRLSGLLVPDAMDPDLEAQLQALVGEGAAFDPTTLDDEDLSALAEGLRGLEATVSGHRKAMFGAIDAVEGEIARRYRAGDASVDSLLR